MRIGGGAGNFFFAKFPGELRGHRDGHGVVDGVAYVCGVLSLRHFGLARWCSLSLGGWSPKTLARRSSTCSGRLGGAAAAGRTMVMSTAAPSISTLVIFRFGADDGARAIGATDDAAAAELPGRRRRQP